MAWQPGRERLMDPTAVGADRADSRASLREIVACLARQIDDGSLPIVDDMRIQSPGIDRDELQRLAALCDSRCLPHEAARIRRWIAV